MQDNKYFSLDCINNSRVQLLGIATLMVIFFHMYSLDFYEMIDTKWIANILTFFKSIGNFGVDIFLFLSGIGLYLSYSKNGLKKFYKNRFLRILPKFILVVVLYYIIIGNITIRGMFESVFFISFFINGVRDGWFLQFIMALYIVFPLIYKVIKKYDLAGMFIGLLLVVVFNFVYSYFFPIYYFNIEIGLTRIPVFLIGVLFGKKIYEGKTIPINIIYLSMLFQIIITIIMYFNYDVSNFFIILRYLYCFLAISFVINYSFLYSFIVNKEGILIKILKFFGNHSLEFYLVYEKLCYILSEVFYVTSHIYLYFGGFILTILFAYLLRKVNKLF